MIEAPADQAPGYYRTRVGDVVVTTLSDGYLPAGIGALNNIEPPAIRRIIDAHFLPETPLTQVNVFAIHAGGRVALVDTGGGQQHMAASVGRLAEAMAAARIDQACVDVVLLTHIHPDHVYGLVDKGGEPLFPNASVAMHEEEHRFWLTPGNVDHAPPQAQKYFASSLAALAPYAGRIITFKDGDEVFPGVTAVHLPGHTPGHSGFRVTSGPHSLFIWGDITHVPEIQLIHPEVGIAFDVDTAAAAATRKRVLEEVARERSRVAGLHFHFPGFGYVERRQTGYGLVVEPWRNTV